MAAQAHQRAALMPLQCNSLQFRGSRVSDSQQRSVDETRRYFQRYPKDDRPEMGELKSILLQNFRSKNY
jgi:hypothetical protein